MSSTVPIGINDSCAVPSSSPGALPVLSNRSTSRIRRCAATVRRAGLSLPHTLSLALSLSSTHALSLSLYLSLTHSLTHSLSLFLTEGPPAYGCSLPQQAGLSLSLDFSVSLALSLSLSLSLFLSPGLFFTHAHTHSLTHSFSQISYAWCSAATARRASLSLSFSLSLSLACSFSLYYTHTLSLSLFLSLSLSLTHTHTGGPPTYGGLSVSLSPNLSLIYNAHSHSHTLSHYLSLSLSLSHTHALTHSHTLSQEDLLHTAVRRHSKEARRRAGARPRPWGGGRVTLRSSGARLHPCSLSKSRPTLFSSSRICPRRPLPTKSQASSTRFTPCL